MTTLARPLQGHSPGRERKFGIALSQLRERAISPSRLSNRINLAVLYCFASFHSLSVICRAEMCGPLEESCTMKRRRPLEEERSNCQGGEDERILPTVEERRNEGPENRSRIIIILINNYNAVLCLSRSPSAAICLSCPYDLFVVERKRKCRAEERTQPGDERTRHGRAAWRVPRPGAATEIPERRIPRTWPARVSCRHPKRRNRIQLADS